MNVKDLDKLVAKSDNPAKMKKIIDQLKETGFDDAFNTGREIKLLPNLLDDDEDIKAAASGFVPKSSDSILIVVTNKRVFLENKKILFGSQNTDIPLSKVNSVSYNTGLIFGKISFTNGADTIEITQIKKQDAEPLANAIKHAANAYQEAQLHQHENNIASQTVQSANDNTTITADKLKEMKGLVDAGIISNEEFEAAKKKYLGL